MTALAALVLTAAIYGLCWIALRGSFIGAVLMERGWVPYVVMLMSAWAGCDLFLKHRQLKRELRALNLDLLPKELGERITAESAGGFREHVANVDPVASGTLITRRLKKALQHFETRGSAQELSEYLGRQSENDQAVADGRYSMVRVFIWAIPILGFIGTVLGIGEAVGMFSDAIDASGELQAIKDSLGGVTTGLAWAFDTTLVALVMSLVVMLPASSLQTREEQLVGEVDEYCDEHLVRRLQEEGGDGSVSQVVQAAIKRGLQEHADEMEGWTGRVEGVADTLTDRLAAGWRKVQDQSSAHYADVLDKARAHQVEQLGNSAASLEQARAEGRVLVAATRETLSEFAQSREREGERLEALLTRWQEQQAQHQSETAASSALIARALTGAHEALTRDAEAARQAVESSMASLAPAVEARLTTLGKQASELWGQQLERLAESQGRSAEELRRAQESVNESTAAGAQRLTGWGEELRAAITTAGDALKAQVQEAGAAQARLAEEQRAAVSDATAGLERAQASVNETTAADAKRLAGWGAELQAAIAAAGTALQAQVREASEAQAGLAEEQRAAARDAAARLERTSERVESGLERQVAASEASRGEQSSAMEAGARRFAEALERAQDKLNSQTQSLADAQAGHEQLVTLQRGLAANLEVLARSDSLTHTHTLAGLEERLALLDKTLTGIDARTPGRQGMLGRIFRGSS